METIKERAERFGNIGLEPTFDSELIAEYYKIASEQCKADIEIVEEELIKQLKAVPGMSLISRSMIVLRVKEALNKQL